MVSLLCYLEYLFGRLVTATIAVRSTMVAGLSSRAAALATAIAFAAGAFLRWSLDDSPVMSGVPLCRHQKIILPIRNKFVSLQIEMIW